MTRRVQCNHTTYVEMNRIRKMTPSPASITSTSFRMTQPVTQNHCKRTEIKRGKRFFSTFDVEIAISLFSGQTSIGEEVNETLLEHCWRWRHRRQGKIGSVGCFENVWCHRFEMKGRNEPMAQSQRKQWRLHFEKLNYFARSNFNKTCKIQIDRIQIRVLKLQMQR